MTAPAEDLLIRRIGRLLTVSGPAGVDPIVEQAALVVRGGRVDWLGAERDLPAAPGELEELDAGGAVVLPGFVDPHTHLVWAGSRREELAARLEGSGYDGGGIRDTVAATRKASYDELVALTSARAAAALRNGTTTMEIKSGYGLSPEYELRALDVVRDVASGLPLRIDATYLGAHTFPAGADRDEYVDEVVATLPAAAEHGARWCDVFCDRGVFTVDEARRILTAAREAGLGLRMHAEQLDRTGGAALAGELGCASADHLDHVDVEEARAMAAAGVAGVVLPGVPLTLRTGHWDAARVLADAGVTLALGTDCNPGTSWCESMPFVVALGSFGYGLAVPEALRAATRGAAVALRRGDAGRLAVGAYGDAVVLDAEHEADLVAHLGAPAVRDVVVGGRVMVDDVPGMN
jgi:imidazolonepropionase